MVVNFCFIGLLAFTFLNLCGVQQVPEMSVKRSPLRSLLMAKLIHHSNHAKKKHNYYEKSVVKLVYTC